MKFNSCMFIGYWYTWAKVYLKFKKSGHSKIEIRSAPMFICLYIIYIFITKCCMLLYVYYRISLMYVCFWSLQVFLKFDMTMVYFSMYCCNVIIFEISSFQPFSDFICSWLVIVKGSIWFLNFQGGIAPVSPIS